jgi:hypothetical protein
VATAGEAVPAEATPSADATTPEVAVPPAESEPEPATGTRVRRTIPLHLTA